MKRLKKGQLEKRIKVLVAFYDKEGYRWGVCTFLPRVAPWVEKAGVEETIHAFQSYSFFVIIFLIWARQVTFYNKSDTLPNAEWVAGEEGVLGGAGVDGSVPSFVCIVCVHQYPHA